MPADAAVAATGLPPSLREQIAGRAAAVDAAADDPRRTLVELADARLLTLGVPGLPGSVAEMAAVLGEVAEDCVATAFCAWGHRMTVEYLASVADGRFDELVSLRRIGSSAMAGAFKFAAGIEPLAVRGRREGGELVLDGRIAWASNLHADALIVLAAAVDGLGPVVLTLDADADGVSVRNATGLLALDATASGAIVLDGVRVPADDLLDEPFEQFLARVRRPFLSLQSGFCLGLARAALDAAAGNLEGLGSLFAAEHEELSAQVRGAADRLSALADDPAAGRRELVRLRLDVALLARDAVRVEAAVTGGRGYVASSPTARRLREAAFLPVQSPTEAHLRWELR